VMTGRHSFKCELGVRFVACLVLFCTSLGVFSQGAVGREGSRSSGSTYCPLQRKWVKNYFKDLPAKYQAPLDKICGSDRQKDEFFWAASKTAPLLRFIPNSTTVENLFFDYLKKDKKSFQAILRAPHRRPANDAVIGYDAESKVQGSDFKNSFDGFPALITGKFQTPSSLVLQTGVSSEREPVFLSDDTSSRTQPRAPPFSK
jgi:hypothetical protein